MGIKFNNQLPNFRGNNNEFTFLLIYSDVALSNSALFSVAIS
jgi:hypothetical protein